MCGRYTLTKPPKDIRKAFPVEIPDYKPNYNLAPTQKGLVITSDEPSIAQEMHFGLVPHWASSTKLSFSTLNARREEALTSKTWAPLIKHSKVCLVLADAFIEWDKKSGKSLPWLFRVNDMPVFPMAGLWSQWKSSDGTVVYRSYTIMTTEANKMVGQVHDPKFRMPVIFTPEQQKLWMDPTLSPTDRIAMCETFPDELMNCHRISTDINTAAVKGEANNRPELILPINSQ